MEFRIADTFTDSHSRLTGDPKLDVNPTLNVATDDDVWTNLSSDFSRPFGSLISGRIDVKVINHLENDVMKLFRVS